MSPVWKKARSRMRKVILKRHPMRLIGKKGTRIRQQFNPNQMPSGTREMEDLTRQIEEDPTSSEDEASDSPASEPEHLGLCMALQAAEESVPRSWKHAVHVPQWLDAMKVEKGELEGKEA